MKVISSNDKAFKDFKLGDVLKSPDGKYGLIIKTKNGTYDLLIISPGYKESYDVDTTKYYHYKTTDLAKFVTHYSHWKKVRAELRVDY